LGLEKYINIKKVDEFSRSTPCLANVQPVGQYYLPDFHEEGGIPALMTELQPLLNPAAKAVGGKTIQDWVKRGESYNKKNRRTIFSLKEPLLPHGGIAVLQGNLAPLSSLARMLNNTIPYHRGPARCFNSQEEGLGALKSKQIKEGEVIIIRYAGPRGAPGMPDIYALLAGVVGMGLEGKVAVVTDGRFSGFARGLGVCQVSPEAAIGGPLALLRDGDIITISLPERSLQVEISAEEMEKRRRAWTKPPQRKAPGILGLFAEKAEQAHQGARLVAHPAPWEEI
jgi:dihydroxy-acid dehydratase